MTDRDIAHDIHSRLENQQNQLHYTHVRDSMAGKVRNIIEDCICVDVGLSNLQPIVKFEQMSLTDIENKADLEGKLLEFQIISITFDRDANNEVNQVSALELSRKGYTQLDSVVHEVKKTDLGVIVRVVNGDEINQPGVIFRIEEKD